MADQGRWFKLWVSALSDGHLLQLAPEIRWAWAALGAHTKEQGTKGVVTIPLSDAVLAAKMGVQPCELLVTVRCLPHVYIEEGKNGDGTFTVTWHNWPKYQEDTTGAQRMRALRSKRRREEKRGEEKKTKNKTSEEHTVGSDEPTGFVTFWKLYPEPKGSKAQALKAFRTVHPPETIAGILQAQLLHKIACDKAGIFWPRFPHACRYLSHRRWTDEIPQALATGAQAPEATPPADAKARWNSREEYAVARKAGRVPLPERVVEWENSNTPST